jgi:hypothetical protein
MGIWRDTRIADGILVEAAELNRFSGFGVMRAYFTTFC